MPSFHLPAVRRNDSSISIVLVDCITDRIMNLTHKKGNEPIKDALYKETENNHPGVFDFLLPPNRRDFPKVKNVIHNSIQEFAHGLGRNKALWRNRKTGKKLAA
jgi:hypothetical protein